MKYKLFCLSFSLLYLFCGCGNNSEDYSNSYESTSESYTENITNSEFSNSSNLEISENEAINIYNQAVKKLENYTSYEMYVDNSINISSEGNNVSTSQKTNITKFGKNEDIISNLDTIEITGKNRTESMNYYRDGFFYIENASGKFKIKMDYSYVLKSLAAELCEISYNILSEEPKISEKNEKKNIEFIFDVDKLKEENPKLLQNILYYLGLDHKEDLELEKCILKAVINSNGDIENHNIEIDAAISDYMEQNRDIIEKKRNFNMNIEILLSDFNNVYIEDSPEIDFSSYVEMNN